VDAAAVVVDAAAVAVVEVAAGPRAVAEARAEACRAVAVERGLLHVLPRCHGPDRRRFGGRAEVRAVALRAIGHQRAECRRLVDQPAVLEIGLAQETGLAPETLPIAQQPGRAAALVQVPALALGQAPVALLVHDRADEDRVVASYPTSLICQMPAVEISEGATSVAVGHRVG
jgi:hypothetical protein